MHQCPNDGSAALVDASSSDSSASRDAKVCRAEAALAIFRSYFRGIFGPPLRIAMLANGERPRVIALITIIIIIIVSSTCTLLAIN